MTVSSPEFGAPSISVVVPTHLRIAYLLEALESVRAQTFTDFECIVVGDVVGEADEIRGLIAGMEDPRFTYRLNADAPGGNGSRNLGLRLASGSIVAFLDDDDWWAPAKLEKHFSTHRHTGAALVFSGARVVVEPGRVVKGQWRAPSAVSDARAWLARGNCPATSTIVSLRRDILDKSGLFDESLVSVQDWDMWMRVADHGPFATITEPLAFFRQHPGDRTSRNPDRRITGIDQIEAKWRGLHDISGFVATLRSNVAIDQAMADIESGRKWTGLKSGLANLWAPARNFAFRRRVRGSLELLAACLR